MWEFWRRHKRKLYVTLGLLGSGYFLYKLYDARRRRLSDLEKELAVGQENDALIKAQMQAHFENIQRIADTTALPHAMLRLRCRVPEELDLVRLTERLRRGKDHPNTLTSSERLQLWDRLKILSFTRMSLSLWAMTMLSLYIRVQVNILGRHLYIDTARGLGSPRLLEAADQIGGNDEQQFLAIADFLCNDGMPTLIFVMQAATTEVLKGKQLKDFFNATVLHETISQILDTFMSMGRPHHWVDYLMPQDARVDNLVPSSSTDSTDLSHATKFDQLMVETRTVLSSAEFGNIVDMTLKTVVDALMEDMELQSEGNLLSGMPLAKLLPQVAHMGLVLLEEPSSNRFIQIIQNIQEVELFFTLLYARTPAT